MKLCHEKEVEIIKEESKKKKWKCTQRRSNREKMKEK